LSLKKDIASDSDDVDAPPKPQKKAKVAEKSRPVAKNSQPKTLPGDVATATQKANQIRKFFVL
jgi:hypothetical protein